MPRDTVLIAEDDRMTRRILEHLFESHPALAPRELRLLMAADGHEALYLFHRNAPALVILDLFMPRMDGFEVCRSIRKAAHGADTPIIVTSAIWKQPDVRESLSRDFGAAFLAKPFQVEELAALVLLVLGDAPAT
jgi:CheY-like chemotaxis protein